MHYYADLETALHYDKQIERWKRRKGQNFENETLIDKKCKPLLVYSFLSSAAASAGCSLLASAGSLLFSSGFLSSDSALSSAFSSVLGAAAAASASFFSLASFSFASFSAFSLAALASLASLASLAFCSFFAFLAAFASSYKRQIK